MSTAAWSLNIAAGVASGNKTYQSTAIQLQGATQLIVLASSLPSDANPTGTPSGTLYPFTFSVKAHTANAITTASTPTEFGLGWDAAANSGAGAAVRLPLAPSTQLLQCDIVSVDVVVGDTSWFGTHTEMVTVDVFASTVVEALPPALPAVALPLVDGTIAATPATGARATPAVDVTSGGSQLVTAGPGTALDVVLRALAISLGGGATQPPIQPPPTTATLYTLVGGMPDVDWRFSAGSTLVQTTDGGLRLTKSGTGTGQLELRSACTGAISCSVSFMVGAANTLPVLVNLSQRINAPAVSNTYTVGLTVTPTTTLITSTGAASIDVSALVRPSLRLTTVTFNVTDSFITIYFTDTVTTASTLLASLVRVARCPLWLSLAAPAPVANTATLYSAAQTRAVLTNQHAYSIVGSYLVLPDIVTFNGSAVSACNARSLRLVGVCIDPSTVTMWIYINTNQRYVIPTAPVPVDPHLSAYSVTPGPPAYDTLARTDNSIQSMAAISTWYPAGTTFSTPAAAGVSGILVYSFTAKQNSTGLLASGIEAADIRLHPGDDLLVMCVTSARRWDISASASLQWIEY
jgi:hypothetical protein